MGARFMIVGDVARKYAAQMRLAQNDDVIQTLAAQGSDQAFCVWIGVSHQLHRRRAVRRKPFESPIPFIPYVAGPSS
jgi:hypothetical protein